MGEGLGKTGGEGEGVLTLLYLKLPPGQQGTEKIHPLKNSSVPGPPWVGRDWGCEVRVPEKVEREGVGRSPQYGGETVQHAKLLLVQNFVFQKRGNTIHFTLKSKLY